MQKNKKFHALYSKQNHKTPNFVTHHNMDLNKVNCEYLHIAVISAFKKQTALLITNTFNGELFHIGACYDLGHLDF